ncbi:MAG: hypothetical protein Q9212_005359 [Teloschistes hypoglaucus]
MELPQWSSINAVQGYIGSVFYCLYFHPLAKYPGPFLAKVSRWPSYYHTLKGDRHIWTWQNHQIYGSVFRHHPNGLLFDSPAAWRAIYDTKANVKKGTFYQLYPRAAGVHNVWNCIDKTAHARKRRILNAAFSDKALRALEPSIIAHADRWCEILLQSAGYDWSTPRNIAEWSDRLVFDILGELCYAKAFDTMEPGKDDLKFIPRLMMQYTTFLYLVAHSPIQNIWLWLKPKGLDKLVDLAASKDIKTYTGFTSSWLERRMDEEKNVKGTDLDQKTVRKDLFHYLFQAKDPATGAPGYSHTELLEENNLLVIAGADTTSTTIAAMFFYLVRNSEVYRRLTDEVRGTFKTAEDICTGSQLGSCRYLRAFIDEALRMNAPVSAELPRQAEAGGIAIDGQFLPQGTEVAVSLYSLHHNEDFHHDAFHFRPERWLPSDKGSTSTTDLATAESAFAPFSSGSRGCPGKNLAYIELSIVMAKILFRADVRLAEGDHLGEGRADLGWGRRNKSQFQTKDAFVSAREGPIVQLKAVRG